MSNLMSQIAALQKAHEDAARRPNPPQPINRQTDGTAAVMVERGATHRINRYGIGGAWVGYDYLNANGETIYQSMSAV